MKKNLLALCTAALLLAALCSCGASAAAANETLGDTIGCPVTIRVDGKVYTFPADTAAVFEADGWVVEEEYAGMTLDDGDDVSTVSYTKNGNSITLNIENLTEEPLPLNACTITEMAFSENRLEDVEVVLAGGLTFGAAPDDVLALYGDPRWHNVYDEDNWETITYLFKNAAGVQSIWDDEITVGIWAHGPEGERYVDYILFEFS